MLRFLFVITNTAFVDVSAVVCSLSMFLWIIKQSSTLFVLISNVICTIPVDYTEFMLLYVDSLEDKCLSEKPNYVNNPCGLRRVHVTACGFLRSQVFKGKP